MDSKNLVSQKVRAIQKKNKEIFCLHSLFGQTLANKSALIKENTFIVRTIDSNYISLPLSRHFAIFIEYLTSLKLF